MGQRQVSTLRDPLVQKQLKISRYHGARNLRCALLSCPENFFCCTPSSMVIFSSRIYMWNLCLCSLCRGIQSHVFEVGLWMLVQNLGPGIGNHNLIWPNRFHRLSTTTWWITLYSTIDNSITYSVNATKKLAEKILSSIWFGWCYCCPWLS